MRAAPAGGESAAAARVASADPAPLRKHGAVGLILACYTLGLVLLQLLLIRTGAKPVLHPC